MKKLILITALIAISLRATLYAQNDYVGYGMKRMDKSKTELTFNANQSLITIKDFVVLKEGRMILELSGSDDYSSFSNLDSLLSVFRKDIAFYKDSLDTDPTGGVRIDYALNEEYPFKKIRFKKYRSDGNIFLNQGGDISKMKFEQDTIRIIMQKSKPGLGSKKNGGCMIPYSIQATFILSNYYDIDKVIAGHTLKGIVDTLEKACNVKGSEKGWYWYIHPTSFVYNPYYTGANKLQSYKRLISSEYDVYPSKSRRNAITVPLHIGAGLTRNIITPSAEAGIQFQRYTRWNSDNYDYFKLTVSPYFFFEKDLSGNYLVKDNWFANLDIGSVYESNDKSWLGKRASVGVGYLVINKGNYFKNTTMKLYSELEIRERLTICPELIFTDNFKQIFPGFTLKVF